MCVEKSRTDAGFYKEPIPIGSHICLPYSSEEERRETLQQFVLSGLKNGERTACFSSKVTERDFREFLKSHDLSYDEYKRKEMLLLADTKEAYFEDRQFTPARSLKKFADFYESSIKMGYQACRVIGEMIPEIESIPGGELLPEYESRITLLLQHSPVTSVCQYNVNTFQESTLMEILKVHPQIFLNGSIMPNPYYVHPLQYMRESNAKEQVQG